MLISNGQIREGNFVFIERASKKIFQLKVEKKIDSLALFLKGDKLFYSEKYVASHDSFFLLKRVFKVGLLTYDLNYSPIRLRFILPFEKEQKWQYEGIEKSSFHKAKIKSYGFVSEDETGYKIFNITFRNDSPDTSILEFDRNFTINKIFIELPEIFLLKQLLGFKTSRLVFENYGEK
ncbi:MAG: hypothetical protein ABIN39_06165 [candidate division WOR-3 bacterium]